MNPKQLACVVLMIFVGIMTYFAQVVHQKVAAMKADAEAAKADAESAASAHQTAELLTARTKTMTEDKRRFLQAWTPFVDKVQTEQEVESAVEFSLREMGINLVRSRKSEVRPTRDSKFMPKTVLTTLTVEDEYAKVLNWMGDIEKRLPIARVVACHVTGGATARQLKLDITLSIPLIDLKADDSAKTGDKKKT